MIVDPKDSRTKDIYKLMIGSITPRPIAFVSSRSSGGVNNLAPYSFFTGVSVNPPAIGFSPLVNFEGRLKDSRINIEECGEFVVNIVSEDLVEKMNSCAVDVPPTVDEFNISCLTPVASDVVGVPRVKEARVSMECKLLELVEISKIKMGGAFIIGEVVRFHVDDSVVEDFRINPKLLATVGRMGGNTYCRTKDLFEMERPDLEQTMNLLKQQREKPILGRE